MKKLSSKPLDKEWYSESNIQKVLRSWKSQPKYIMEGLYVFQWESDFLIKMKSGLWYEVEIKISLSDFKHDFTKEDKHHILQHGFRYDQRSQRCRTEEEAQRYIGPHLGSITPIPPSLPFRSYYIYEAVRKVPVPCQRPHHFCYCVPYWLQDKVLPLLPDYAGLLVVDEYGRIETVKAPPRIHKDPLHELAFNLQDKFYYNWRNTLDALERGNKDETIRRLRGEVQWLTAEYKAATGYDISECF